MDKINHSENGSRGYLASIVMVAVLGGLLFGYDTAVISGAEKGLQAFFLGAPDFKYSDFMHGFTSSSALIGCIIGSALSGFFAGRLGRKKSLIFAGVCFFISAWGSMEPETFGLLPYGKPSWNLLIVFNLYRVLGGIGVGMASALCPMYIGEISPSNIRGMLVSFNQFAIIFGQLVVYFVNFMILGDHTNPIIESVGQGFSQVMPGSDPWSISTGWRYMFGSECVPAGLFTLLICFVPESPRYLVMTGRDTKAMSVLSRINGFSKAQEIIADIKATLTTKTEKLFTYGFMCVFVGIMLSVFQQAVGINAVLYYAPRIFADMGMGNPMMQTVIMGVINITFTLVAVFTVEKIGRKPLLISGSIGMGIGAFVVALTFGNSSLNIVTMVALMVYSASFMFSWGPICWVYMAELFPNTIRGTATAIAVAFQWIFNFIVSSSFVPMFNMHLTKGDDFGHWFTYGLYGIICFVAAVFVGKLVPETKGKTLEDMTALWKERMKK
ncbi:D-xylose transporter XylE [Prevotella lacticifex]|jgi:SP family xylose:H+ symportor-like MFS transporter|uniref:D-xylose transporter XylE n=1 Tax=Prevotella lacticifex TaxID=2854755 RepID=A0A9R1CBC4_9BACT|nr:D-xylose transporter XylE [Prevotella lacticifex]GJG38786.1 D-xylose transporter XylE [Prevotella lacticifex]GJG42532.1 D-xylose transporter XylE [Prevotella lacticifex]GJG45142.1 D-xylose transporter XylE [Prevotella lacticifex]GJG48883.1 D-xylose transporter XylE [Prevotella lacticifex]